MSAAITDKLDRVTDSTTGRPTLTQLATPGKAIGASAITCLDLTNWTTTSKIHFSIYNVTSAGVKDPTTQTDWTGLVSGNTVTSLVLTGGTDRVYNPGAIVDATPTAAWAKDLYDNVAAHSNQDGSLITAAVQAALGIGNLNTGFTPLGFVLTYGVNNGNKEFTVTCPSDLTSTLSAGMKIQLTRSVAAPTQCMSCTAASSQYATKTSPAGITFTGPFTCEAWVNLASWGVNGGVIGRDSGSGSGSGFGFYIAATGQPTIYWRNSGGFSQFQAAQSINKNKWVHVAVVVTSLSSPAATFYIDGMAVPGYSSATSATTLVQGGPLQIGALNSSSLFDGYISEARIWGVAQSQSAIQSNMGLSLVGSETNLVALFQGNGNFNDKTSNANNLTATNGASSTQAANPYKTNEYAFVILNSYTNPTDTLTLRAVSNVIPNMAFTGAQFSVVDLPFGWPSLQTSLRNLRLLDIPVLNAQSTSAGSAAAFTPITTIPFTVPANCDRVVIKAFDTSVSSAGTPVFELYNGPITAAGNIAQINHGGAAGQLKVEIPVPVVPGSSFSFTIQWGSAGGGTANWQGGVSQEYEGWWVEAG